MKIRTMLAATAALTMAATPVLANAAPAVERASAPVAGASQFGGETEEGTGAGVVLGLLALAAIIAAIVIAAGGGNDDRPIST